MWKRLLPLLTRQPRNKFPRVGGPLLRAGGKAGAPLGDAPAFRFGLAFGPAFRSLPIGYDAAMRHSALLFPALLLPAFLLAACGKNDTDPGPGGVTVGEARALDEAAEMIESRKLPEDALEPEAGSAPAAGSGATTTAPTAPTPEPAR